MTESGVWAVWRFFKYDCLVGIIPLTLPLGQIAKENLLRRMYADYNNRWSSMLGESGQSNVMVASPDYMPAYLTKNSTHRTSVAPHGPKGLHTAPLAHFGTPYKQMNIKDI